MAVNDARMAAAAISDDFMIRRSRFGGLTDSAHDELSHCDRIGLEVVRSVAKLRSAKTVSRTSNPLRWRTICRMDEPLSLKISVERSSCYSY